MTNNSLQRADEGPSNKIPAMGETFVRKPKVRLPLGQGKEATQWRRPQSALDPSEHYGMSTAQVRVGVGSGFWEAPQGS